MGDDTSNGALAVNHNTVSPRRAYITWSVSARHIRAQKYNPHTSIVNLAARQDGKLVVVAERGVKKCGAFLESLVRTSCGLIRCHVLTVIHDAW